MYKRQHQRSREGTFWGEKPIGARPGESDVRRPVGSPHLQRHEDGLTGTINVAPKERAPHATLRSVEQRGGNNGSLSRQNEREPSPRTKCVQVPNYFTTSEGAAPAQPAELGLSGQGDGGRLLFPTLS